MRTLRIFVSSPRDVGDERAVAANVVCRLQFEFRGLVGLDAVFWEQMPMRATGTFQAQIPLASEADLCVFILWSWYGTPLPPAFHRPDGSHYASGTEFEFESALDGHLRRGSPDILVYRKTAEVRDRIGSREEVLERLAQRDAVQSFIDRYFRGEGGSFKAAFREFEKPADFEEMLETHLRELIRERLHTAGEANESFRGRWTQSPFRGLEPFDLEHALIYCGRTRAVTEVLDALRHQANVAHPFVLVIGNSGVGKSSLVRAGVLPTMIQTHVVENVIAWRLAVLRPSDTSRAMGGPVANLAAALIEDGALPELRAGGTDSDSLAELLRDKPAALAPALALALDRVSEQARQAAPEIPQSGSARLALVVDQLEEIFAATVGVAERDAFVKALAGLARTGVVWVLASMRSDFHQSRRELPEAFRELMQGNGTYELDAPRPAEIAQMIRGPALIAGLEFEKRPESEEGLDDVLRDAAAANPTALPLLEFALDELYKQRSGKRLCFAAYERLGGLEGALRKRAEDEYRERSAVEQAALPVLLSSLVRIGLEDGALTSRRVARALLSSTPGALDLVDAFVAARLLVADREKSEDPTVGVAHEALLREWPRAQAWIAENLERLRTRARVAAAEVLWRQSGRDTAHLLPEGKALIEAAALLADGAVQYSPPVANFVTVSLEQAARRRRRRHIVQGAAAAALLLILGGCAWYYDAYLATHARYYNIHFTKRFGVPEGWGPVLTEDAVRHRNQTLKLSFAGRQGRLRAAEVVNGHGLCPQDHSIGTFFGDIDENMTSRRECRWEFAIEDGKAVGEVAFDRNHRRIYAFIYSDENKTTAEYYASKGPALVLAHSGASRVRFTRIPEGPHKGIDSSVIYLNAYGRPQPDRYGAYGQQWEYDVHGRKVRSTLIDENGLSFLPRELPAAARTKYDNSGNEIEVAYEDEEGHPMRHPGSGAAFVRYENDEYGNRVTATLFDESEKLVRGTDGYARSTRQYDEWGNVARVTFWDAYGEKVRTKSGYAEMSHRYDAEGRMIEESYYDEQGLPAVLERGEAKVQIAYDSQANPVDWRYLDGAGNPATLSEGYARESRDYDDYGNLIGVSYFDKDGGPAIHKDGSARHLLTRDDNGQLIAIAFLDRSGRRARNANGYAEVRYTYNDRGNITGEAYLDEDGIPVAATDGASKGVAKTVRVFDDHGNPLEEAYFDANDRPVHVSGGYAVVRRAFDRRGNTTELLFFADPVRLRDPAVGCPRIAMSYDNRSRKTQWSCRDREGRLVLPPEGPAKTKWTFNARGEEVEEARLNDADKPMIGADGYATARFGFDDEGNIVEATFLDEIGQPAVPKAIGCAHLGLSYAKGKRVGRRCLDADAPPPISAGNPKG
jgi:hypothetical protein